MKSWLGKILLAGAAVLFALVLVEAGLALFGVEYPLFYEYDPVLGTRLRPGKKGYWLKEGRGFVSINSDGLRDREHSLEKPPNTLRIAVLGDSYAEAMQVNQEETFWAVLEKELSTCEALAGRQVEVINFGQSGFGTTLELMALRHRVWKYDPDIILLAFCTGNDIADNSPILNQRPGEPFFVFRNGELVLDDSRVRSYAELWAGFEKNRNWLGDFYIWRQENIRMLQVLNHAKNVVKQWWDNWGSEKSLQRDVDIYHTPTDEVWQEAWRLTEAVLLKMRDEVEARGARFFVVVLTNGPQVYPDEAMLKAFVNWPGVEDPFYPDRRLENFGRQHGIPVLPLAPIFQEYALRHKVFLHGFRQLFRNTLGSGHWNQDGHRLAGQTIARWLCPQLR